ncbi:HAD-IA family hydrolase [Paludibacteraceae bacterium OttesenSCG-928-F17]|nr:HAD-IA family hydrolase [Paludibacteraceae bacterium OttesenSCG-928-F17]
MISNGPTEVQHKKMNNTSLHPYFEHVVFSEDVKALKPSKQIFEHALKLNKATPDEAIMIGDNYYADITGAQNAGIDQIYFNYRGYELQEDEKSTHIVNSLEEIIHIL